MGWLPHWQALTVVCSAIIYMIEFYLDVRQSRHLRKCPLPDRLKDHIDGTLFARVKAYVRDFCDTVTLTVTRVYYGSISLVLKIHSDW